MQSVKNNRACDEAAADGKHTNTQTAATETAGRNRSTAKTYARAEHGGAQHSTALTDTYKRWEERGRVAQVQVKSRTDT